MSTAAPAAATPEVYLARFSNALQIVLVQEDASVKLATSKAMMNSVHVLSNASLIVGLDGNVADVGPAHILAEKYSDAKFEHDVDASDMCIVPGLCDAHTHPVWTGDRVNEFSAKLAGATYMDIHKAGGGIGATVRSVHQASENDLYDLLVPRLETMLANGTTLCEAKSGYGLDLANELKMLRVLQRAHDEPDVAVELVGTYLGAHSVPQGSTAAQATRDIVDVQLPELRRLKAAGELSVVEHVDVFLEKGVFEPPEAQEILEAARDAGFALNFHGDELHACGAAEIGAALGARTVSHLEWVSPAGIQAMRDAAVCAVLLPTTAYALRIHPAPARDLIDADVPVALGSDYNPNVPCSSMPVVMNMACVMMKMTVEESLVAATLNGAASMGKGASHGSLAVGRTADLLVLKAPRWEHLIYQCWNPPIAMVCKSGVPVWTKHPQS